MNKKTAEQGLIFNIQRFSVHDGPGLRDLVFMKGCPLRCQCCSNPESQNAYPEIAYTISRCIACGRCEEVCPASAITKLADGKVQIDSQACTNCGECVRVCPSRAIRMFGEQHTVDSIARLVEEDGVFYSRSGGGVTVSGGEPLFQSKFVSELLRTCRERGINTALETSGHAKWAAVEKVCAYADLILYDIKHIDPKKHKAFTGVSNKLILENIKKISSRFPTTPIIARTVIVPGFTDSADNIRGIAEFLSQISSLQHYQLLPYHGFGEPKYCQLGRGYSLGNLVPPSEEQMEALMKIVRESVIGKRISA